MSKKNLLNLSGVYPRQTGGNMSLTPPEGYGVVDKGIYRAGAVELNNSQFLKIFAKNSSRYN